MHQRSAWRCRHSDICVSQTKLLRTNLHRWTAQPQRATWASLLTSFSTLIAFAFVRLLDLFVCFILSYFCFSCLFISWWSNKRNESCWWRPEMTQIWVQSDVGRGTVANDVVYGFLVPPADVQSHCVWIPTLCLLVFRWPVQAAY